MFEKILVPLDGSELAEKVLPAGGGIGEKVQLSSNPDSCLPHRGLRGAGKPPPRLSRTPRLTEKGICETFLSQAAQNLQTQGVSVNWICVEGVPAREIVGYARDHNDGSHLHDHPRQGRGGT